MEANNRDFKKEAEEVVHDVNQLNRQILDDRSLKLEQTKSVEVILDNEGEL